MAVDATFFFLRMGANSSRTTPLKCILKHWDNSDLQNLKRRLIFFCDTEWHSSLWKMGDTGWLKGLNYDTVLQLDQLCRKQEKWAEVPYVVLCETCQTCVLRVQIWM